MRSVRIQVHPAAPQLYRRKDQILQVAAKVWAKSGGFCLFHTQMAIATPKRVAIAGEK